MNMEKVSKGLECCRDHIKDDLSQTDESCNSCPYAVNGNVCSPWELYDDALALLKKQEKEIKALRLLVEWAEECDFGFDQFHDEYERYNNEIKDMKYIDGMIHIAKRTLEDNGAFEEENDLDWDYKAHENPF